MKENGKTFIPAAMNHERTGLFSCPFFANQIQACFCCKNVRVG